MRLHSDRLDVVSFGRLEVGMAEEVGGDADFLGRAVNQLGDGAVPAQVRPDMPAQCLLGAPRES